MRRVLTKVSSILLTFILLVTCVSCKREDNYTNLMWLIDLASGANLSSFKSQEAYFSWQDESNFDNIQSLVEWGVISESDDIDPSSTLTKDFLVYTLDGLIGDVSFKEIEVLDIDSSKYPSSIYKCLYLDIIDLDDDKFHPLATLNKEEAFIYLDRAINYINNRSFINYGDVSFNEELNEVKLPEDYEGYYPITEEYEIGEYLYDEEKGNIYKITAKEDLGYVLEEIDFLEAIEEIDLEGMMEDIDFKDAEIILYGDEVNDSLYRQSGIARMSNKTEEVTNKEGFDISFNFSLNRIHLRVSKETDRGLEICFDGDIYKISPSYKWKYSFGNIEEAYLKVDFKTSEEVYLRYGKYRNLYGDFSALKKEDLFNSLKDFMKEDSDKIDSEFTIATIKVPIPEVPFATIDIDLKLKLQVSGKVEIAMATTNAVGLEIRNNNFRFINDHKEDIDFNINASASSILNLSFSLSLIKRLIDIGVNAGVGALAQTTLHLYDTDGRVTSTSVNGEYDALSELGDRDEVYVCSDLSLHWILNLEFNSKDTIAYIFGFNKKVVVLDEDDQIFNNKHHIENGMFVDKCSYTNRSYNRQESTAELNADRISLDTYNMVVRAQSKIIIKSIPLAYTSEDLRYFSEDENIIKVDSDGNLYPIESGVSRIRVYTSDEEYEIYLTVLVSVDEN